MVWIRSGMGCSPAERRGFHGNDNLGASDGCSLISRDASGSRRGSSLLITVYWSFIHSLLGVKIAGLRRAIITGGRGSLGSAISSKFRSEGWEVVCPGRGDLDLADAGAVAQYFAVESCDLLVCAAGIVRDQPVSRMLESEWDDVFGVNFSAAACCAEAALPGMAVRGSGHVVFISSYAAVHPAVGQAAYATAKAALLGLTKGLAAEYGGAGVRVNAVLPGFLETPMTEAVSPKRKEVVRNLHMLGEFNTVDAAADFIWFLEERMPYTSGQSFSLDSRP